MGKVPEETIIKKYGSIEAYKEYTHKKLSGKHFYTNGIEDRKFSDDEDIPEGWYKGRTNSGKGTKGYIFINNGIKQTQIPKSEEIPKGWVKGALPFSEGHKQNLSKSLKGKTRTEEQCKRISESHKTKEYNDKINATRLEKYGIENFFQDEEIHKKALKNAHTEEARQKCIDTCNKNFGVDYPMQSEVVKETTKKNNLEKYGVEYTMQLPEIKEKAKQTNLDKYGVEYSSQAEEVKEKVRKTNLDRYGVENVAKNEKIKEKMRNTNIQHRGVPYPLNDKKVLEKQIITNQQRNGVTYNIQLPQAQIGSRNSKPNQEFAKLLDTNNIQYEREVPIDKYSFDFKIDNILIEINPSATHNTLWSPFGSHKGIDKNYHYNKTKVAEEQGYRVIHIFDWDDKAKIINLLSTVEEKVYARNTKIIEVDKETTDNFLKQYHLQNTCRGQKVRLGLVDKQYNLIAIMTFGKPRYNKKYEWELLRYCAIKNIIGGAEKLYKYFLDNFTPTNIISYCDKSKFKGDVYQRLGFELIKENKPSKHWYNSKEELSHITDNLLRQRGYDQIFNEDYGKGTSNEELIIKKGYVPIYDCGQNAYGWEKD